MAKHSNFSPYEDLAVRAVAASFGDEPIVIDPVDREAFIRWIWRELAEQVRAAADGDEAPF